MAMNKRGQQIFVGIMIAVMVLLVVVGLINPTKEGIVTARDADHLDCTNSSIAIGSKSTCLVMDMWLFYFTGVALAGGLAFITGKKITGG